MSMDYSRRTVSSHCYQSSAHPRMEGKPPLFTYTLQPARTTHPTSLLFEKTAAVASPPLAAIAFRRRWQPKYLIYDPTLLQGRGNPQLEPLWPIEPTALQKPKTAHLASRWIFFNLGFLYVFFSLITLSRTTFQNH